MERRRTRSTRTRSSSARTAPSPTPARTSPTSSGSSACCDRDFRYRLHSRDADGTPALDDDERRGRAGRAGLRARGAVYNVIDVGQSYPQRVVKAGVAALGHAEAAEGCHHLAYEKVVLSPATARALGYDGLARTTRPSRSRDARASASRPTTSSTRSWRRPAPRSTRATPSATRDRARGARPGPSPRARCATSCCASRARGSSPSTWTRPSPSSARRAPTSRTPSSAPGTSSASSQAEGHDVAASARARRPTLDLGQLPRRARRATRSGRCSCSWPAARTWPSRRSAREEVALVAKHAFAVAQAFHSYYQKPRYSLLHAESDDAARLPRPRRRRLRAADGGPAGPARHPVPERM